MKWLHNILKGASLTGALFVFQACYGTPQQDPAYEYDCAPMSFTVVSHESGEPLEGVAVTQEDYYGTVVELGETGADGKCSVELRTVNDSMGPSYLHFEAPQEKYLAKDTVLTDFTERDILIKMDKD